MKATRAKEILQLVLLVLGIALGREAQAFYNPSTGRSLSRDPIEERGGMNACLSRKAAELNRTLGSDCRDFAGRLMRDCQQESKGCTAPP